MLPGLCPKKNNLYKGNGRSAVKNIEPRLNVSGCSSSRFSLLKGFRLSFDVLAVRLSLPKNNPSSNLMFLEIKSHTRR
jgi:hypothetical protein